MPLAILILRRIERHTKKKKCIGLQVKYVLFLSYFKETGFFLDRFSKKKISQISSFMKMRPVGAESFHEDGQTDLFDEASSRFSKFGEWARKVEKFLYNH